MKKGGSKKICVKDIKKNTKKRKQSRIKRTENNLKKKPESGQ